MKIRLLCIFGIIFLLNGCAATPPALEVQLPSQNLNQPLENQSQVKLVIYNDSNALLFGLDESGKINLHIDGKGVAQLNIGQYIVLAVEKGSYAIGLLHKDIADFSSLHKIEVTESPTYVKIYSKITSNGAETVPKPDNFEEKYKPTKPIIISSPTNALSPPKSPQAFTTAYVGLQPYFGMKDQFELALPAGWSVYDQGLVLSGKPSKTSPLPVVFCSESIDGNAMMSGDSQALKKVTDQLIGVDTGSLAGFTLDRLSAKRGMSCSGFTANAKQVVLDLIGTDPIFGRGRATREKPRAETIVVGGCQGLRIKGKGSAGTGDGRSLDVFAVSDGEVLFLFKLENLDEHYPKNIGTFERIMSTLRLTE